MRDDTHDLPAGAPRSLPAGTVPTDPFDALVEALATAGHGLIENFLAAPVTARLYADLQQQYARSLGRPAAVGRGPGRQVRADIRGDHILWWEPSDLSAAQSDYWEALAQLRQRLNRDLYLGLREIECHYAHYPAGGGYQRHLDAFRGDTKRLISCVFYLNPDWQPGDGGELRLYVPAGTGERSLDIAPRAGTLAVFLSQVREHAVLPTVRDRFSIAAWMRRA